MQPRDIDRGTPPIENSHAEALAELRASYAYPRANIVRSESSGADLRIAESLFGRYVSPNESEITDTYLDRYHQSHLFSSQPAENLLGLASIVYWGFFTFGDQYARVRVERMLHGYKGFPATTPEIAAARTRSMRELASFQQSGASLAALEGVCQLGRTPFASKVVAFMSPNVAGVYDNRIQRGLESEHWATHLCKGVGSVGSRVVRNTYQAWCMHLNMTASQLNLGISHGRNWRWSCGTDRKREWRAIDVERALFAKYASIA